MTVNADYPLYYYDNQGVLLPDAVGAWGATGIAPPSLTAGQVAIWNGDAWNAGSPPSPTSQSPAATSTVVVATAPVAYRAAVVNADLLAAVGVITCTVQAGGAATAGTYTVFAAAGNKYGRTTATQGNTTVVTTGSNLTVRAAFGQVAGAEFYDLYCSVDGAAAKFVGRVTEAQRASGIHISAENVTSAGGTAGAVDIQVPGTGRAVNAGQLAQNTAYAMPAQLINAQGYQYVDYDITFHSTGDIVAPSLVVVPFWFNSLTGLYVPGAAQQITFGGGAGSYNAMTQRLRVQAEGNASIGLLVAQIAGTGASVDIAATLS